MPNTFAGEGFFYGQLAQEIQLGWYKQSSRITTDIQNFLRGFGEEGRNRHPSHRTPFAADLTECNFKIFCTP